MPESLFYTHRQIVEELRSQANLAERRAGAWRLTDEWKDNHQIAQRALDYIMEAFNEIVTRSFDSLPTITQRFTWPANTETIALVPPALDPAHPALTSVPHGVVDLQDETSGVSQGVPLQFADRRVIRNFVRRALLAPARGGLYALVAGGNLSIYPFPAPSLALRIDYVAVPDAVEPEQDSVYRGLPVGVLRATITKAAAELVASRKDAALGVRVAERQQRVAQRANDRMERTGAEYTNWTAGFGG